MKKYPVLLILLLAIALGLAADDEGKAKGELQVSGEKVQLKHAYAIENKNKLSVILSDRPVPQHALENYRNLVELAENGEVRAIEVVIRSKEIADEVFFFDDRLPSKLSVKEPGPFTPKKVNEKLIAGTLVMNDPGFSFGYKAEFSAPVRRIIPKPVSRVGPGASSEDDARAALENMELDFDEETFTSAVQDGNAGAVRLFLQSGMPAIVHGRGALWTAIGWGHVEVAKVLIEAGAVMNERGDYGETMIMKAVDGKLEMVELLIKAGVDVNTPNEYKITPLASAAEQGKKDIVEALLRAGANVKARNTYGGTALQVAVIRGYKDIVKILIDAGADVERDRKELLEYAKQGKNTEIEKMIREAPATPKQ